MSELHNELMFSVIVNELSALKNQLYVIPNILDFEIDAFFVNNKFRNTRENKSLKNSFENSSKRDITHV